MLALERLEEERLAAPIDATETAVLVSPEEEAEAMAFATAPGLIERIADALQAGGLVGERHNGLAIYLGPVPVGGMIGKHREERRFLRSLGVQI